MTRGNVKKIAAMSIVLAIVFSTTAFASTNSPAEVAKKISEKVAAWEGTFASREGRHKKGGPFLRDEILAKLGITREDIKTARDAGKSLFDLAKEKKGLTSDQVKAIVIKAKTDEINKRVEEGKITKDKAEEIISRAKERVNAWDGSLIKGQNFRYDFKKH